MDLAAVGRAIIAIEKGEHVRMPHLGALVGKEKASEAAAQQVGLLDNSHTLVREPRLRSRRQCTRCDTAAERTAQVRSAHGT